MAKCSRLPSPSLTLQAVKRYGYTEAHRREAGAHYSTDLTDAEWMRIADLFERLGRMRGAPPRYDRRHRVDADCYILRTGCAWRLLTLGFTLWQAAYKAFVR